MLFSPTKRRRGGVRRMLIATIAVTLLYIGLQELLLSGVNVLASRGLMSWVPQPKLEQEAREVAEASTAREAMLTPRHRFAAWSLGLHLGGTSQYLGSFGAAEPSVRARARAADAPRLAAAQAHADFLGIGQVAPLESTTATQYGDLTARIDADEGGVGARIAKRTTPRHRHLYLLGMHVGVALRSMQHEAWQGSVPAGLQIARHATLAGLAPEQWEPLARVPQGRTQAEIAAAYLAAAKAAEEAIVLGEFAAKR